MFRFVSFFLFLVVLHTASVAQAADEACAEECPGKEEKSLASEESASQENAVPQFRQFGTPVDVVNRLKANQPSKDSLIHARLPKRLMDFKERVYEQYGLRLGTSYQTLYQKASDSLTGNDTAWGGWFLFQGAWTAINRDRDWQGKFVFALDGRHVINSGSNVAPGLFQLETGSLWPTDSAFYDWNVYPAIFFWEQWGRSRRFAFRVGQQGVLSALDSFRFDEFRSSFTSSIMAAPVSVLPIGPPGLSLAAKWWPVDGSDLYVRGVVSDINSPSGKVDWSGLFDYGEVLAGTEVGYNWVRSRDDFDHAHLTLWYADEVSSAPFHTESGWGFKVSGHKQWGQAVGFASYAYNTVEGGGFGLTLARRAVNVGVALLRPGGIKGEVALGVSWADPLESTVREQSGLEAYWKILVLPNLWVTPGLQIIRHPSFNPEKDSIFISQIKLSLFL